MEKNVLTLHMIRTLMMIVLCIDRLYIFPRIMAQCIIPTIQCAVHISTIHMDPYHTIHTFQFMMKQFLVVLNQNSSRGFIKRDSTLLVLQHLKETDAGQLISIYHPQQH